MKQSGNKQQANERALYGVLGVFVLGCLVFVYMEFFQSPPNPAATAAPVVNTVSPAPVSAGNTPVPGAAAAAKPASAPAVLTVAQMDPTLHMEAMAAAESLEYAGSGRNIFSPNSAPPVRPIPAAVASARPAPVQMPVVQRPVGPPPPPPIELKFFGTSLRGGERKAFLLHGDDVYHAGDGEIVGRRYKVITVGTNSVVVEDMPNNNRQTLPLEAP